MNVTLDFSEEKYYTSKYPWAKNPVTAEVHEIYVDDKVVYVDIYSDGVLVLAAMNVSFKYIVDETLTIDVR